MNKPGSESCGERMGQGSIGRFAPGSELAWERKGCESSSFDRTERRKQQQQQQDDRNKLIDTVNEIFGDTCRFRVLIGNNNRFLKFENEKYKR